jgi:vitamin B12 transporter
VLLLSLYAGEDLMAQDTVALKAVEVSAQKSVLSRFGKKTETVDSLVQQQFKFLSVAELLNSASATFIKTYGPGSLASTAFRGGSASQTALLWNGFNLQNTMLGQTDLALLPSILFDKVEIEYGGSSSLWGSGAVGGSIHLNNRAPFGRGFYTTTSLGAGSFGKTNAATSISLSYKRFVSSTKIYFQDAENNYNYKDFTDKESPEKKMKNASYHFKGMLQELRFLLTEKQSLSVNFWASENERKLPGFTVTSESKGFQYDNALRGAVKWAYEGKKLNSGTNGAVFSERLDFSDSLSNQYGKSKVLTKIIENENFYKWFGNTLNFGVNLTSSKAESNNYAGAKRAERIALLAGNKFYFFNQKLGVHVGGRAEYFSAGALPVTWNVSAEYKLNKHFLLSANAVKVYRQPSLNELYWVPGGNTALKPEKGYSQEGNFFYNTHLKHFSLKISGSIYSRKINDWILWVPGMNGNPAPVNLQQVWSRGAETSWSLNYEKNKFKAGISAATSYVLSTVSTSTQENSATLGRQLAYTPRYLVNSTFSLAYSRVQCFFFHQYVGYRFVTSDNTQWLDPYHNSSAKISYDGKISGVRFILFAGCNNLFNVNYAVLAGRPMPLRNFEFGITIQTSKKIQ